MSKGVKRTNVGNMITDRMRREYGETRSNENSKTKRIKNYCGRNYKPKHRKSKHGKKSFRKMSRKTRRRKT